MITKIKHLREKKIHESIEGNLVVKNVRYKGIDNVFSSDVDVSELRFKVVYRIDESHAADGVSLEFVEIRDVEADTAEATVQINVINTEFTRAEAVENKVGFHIGEIYLDVQTESGTFMITIF